MIPARVRQRRNQVQDAELDLCRAQRALAGAQQLFAESLEDEPPKTFRLQEAYRNPDGSYSTPHWDEVAEYASHSLVDQVEVNEHILRAGEWTEMYHNPEDDPRPGCRRVVEVKW